MYNMSRSSLNRDIIIISLFRLDQVPCEGCSIQGQEYDSGVLSVVLGFGAVR